MVVLHALDDFLEFDVVSNSFPSYYYEGYCPQSGDLLKLPRTALIEAVGCGLMRSLAGDEVYEREGKMYGVLLVETPDGKQRILKAFSGLLNGFSVVEGWVPPIPGRDRVAVDEAQTLTQLDAIKQEIITLKQLPQRQEYERLVYEFEQSLQLLNSQHRDRKHQRHQQRQLFCQTLTGTTLEVALAQLDRESRQDGIERKQLKRQRDTALQPLQMLINTVDLRLRELKAQRKELSRQLQSQMHAAYSLTNFFGTSRSLQQLMPAALPTGTGDCCAPKLLHYAATHSLKPLAMAEFWWGASSSNGDKIRGEFYGACAERCQPIMGFLLSGLQPIDQKQPLSPVSSTGEVTPIYEDEHLIIVNKPTGLLSVPGRYHDTQDSVLSRWRNLLPDTELTAVHRLDRDTSGILVLARNLETYRQLSQQFEQRQVKKVYEALIWGVVTTASGVIELPLWGNPQNRPYQEVNWQYGKPSVTNYQVIATEGNYTRIEFIPLTGRTHQLRVHTAHPKGLGMPILGDKLYGCDVDATRLHLHARELSFLHPQLGKKLHLKAQTPF